MLGLNQQVVDKAVSLSSNYSQDLNGLRQAINDNGGMAQVDAAMKKIDNPLVKKGLAMAGISVDEIFRVYNQLKSETNTPINTGKINNTNPYTERLKRLK